GFFLLQLQPAIPAANTKKNSLNLLPDKVVMHYPDLSFQANGCLPCYTYKIRLWYAGMEFLFQGKAYAAVFFILYRNADFHQLLTDPVRGLVVFFGPGFLPDIDQQVHNALQPF